MPAFVPYLLISCLTCLAMIMLPGLILLWATLWGMLLILAGLETGRIKLAFIFVCNLGVLFLAGEGATFIYSLYIGVPTLVMGILAADQKWGYYDLLKAGLAAAVLTGMLLIGFMYFFTDSASQIEPQINTYVQETLNMYEDTGVFEFYAQKGIEREEIESAFYQLSRTIVKHLPALYYIQAALMVILALYLAALIARRRGITRLKKLPFLQEVMPWQLAWVVIAGLLFWLAGKEGSALRLLGSNLLVVLAPLLFYFGLAVLFYKVGRMNPRSKRWIIVIAVIILVVMTIPAFIFLALLGLFDSLIDYRKLRTDKEAPK